MFMIATGPSVGHCIAPSGSGCPAGMAIGGWATFLMPMVPYAHGFDKNICAQLPFRREASITYLTSNNTNKERKLRYQGRK